MKYHAINQCTGKEKKRLPQLLFLMVATALGLSRITLVGAARTGVLIHGCHLGAKGWRNIMWGNEREQRLGRLPHGAKLAWEENACVVVLGTGASQRDGVIEGRYALEHLTRNWGGLRDFDEAFSGVDLDEMREAVEPLLVAEVQSQNTRQELLEAGRIFRTQKCDRIILVSSPTHLPRCLRDACTLWLGSRSRQSSTNYESRRPTVGGHLDEAGTVAHREIEDDREQQDEKGGEENDSRRRERSWRPMILASPSGTNYAGYGPGDVAIVEPPHRGDSCLGGSAAGEVSSRSSGSSGPSFRTISAPGGDPIGGWTSDGDSSPGKRGGLPQDDTNAAPPLMLHELVALALKVRKDSDEPFRREFQALLRRHADDE